MSRSVISSMQVGIRAPKRREKKCNESRLIAFLLGSISPSGLAGSLHSLADTTTRGHLQGAGLEGQPPRTGEGVWPDSQKQLCFQDCCPATTTPTLGPEHKEQPVGNPDPTRAWGPPPEKHGEGQTKRPCPPAQPSGLTSDLPKIDFASCS